MNPEAASTEQDALTSFQKAIRVAAEWAAHTVLTIFILSTIKLVEWITRLLWGGDKILFGHYKLSYLFDGADCLLLAAFLLCGVYFVMRAYVKG